MKKYSANDLKPLNVDEHIIKAQNMYFGSGGATAERICANIMEGALFLGSEEILTKVVGEWHCICGTPDWFFLADIPYKDPTLLIKEICGFPEAGVNHFRFEVMVRVFSKRAFSYANGEVENISGVPLAEEELNKIIGLIGNWGRIIAFQFSKNV